MMQNDSTQPPPVTPFEETGPDETSFTRFVPLSKTNHGVWPWRGLRKPAATGALAALSFAVLIYFCFRSLASGHGGSRSPLMQSASGVTPRRLMEDDPCAGEVARKPITATEFEKSVLQIMHHMLDLCGESEAWGTAAAELPGDPNVSQSAILKLVKNTKIVFTMSYATSASVQLSDLQALHKAARYLEAILPRMKKPSTEFRKVARKVIVSLVHEMKFIPGKVSMRTVHHCGPSGKRTRRVCLKTLTDITMVLNRVHDRLWNKKVFDESQRQQTKEMLEAEANLEAAAKAALQLANEAVRHRQQITARTNEYLEEAVQVIYTDENNFWKAPGKNTHLVEAIMHACVVETVRIAHETLIFASMFLTRTKVTERVLEVMIVSFRRVSNFLNSIPHQGWRLQQVGPDLAGHIRRMFYLIVDDCAKSLEETEGDAQLIERTKTEFQRLSDLLSGKEKPSAEPIWTAQKALTEVRHLQEMQKGMQTLSHLIASRKCTVLKHTYIWMKKWEPDVAVKSCDGMASDEAETVAGEKSAGEAQPDVEGRDPTGDSDDAHVADPGTPDGGWREDSTDADSPRGAEGGATASEQKDANYERDAEPTNDWSGLRDTSSAEGLAHTNQQGDDEYKTDHTPGAERLPLGSQEELGSGAGPPSAVSTQEVSQRAVCPPQALGTPHVSPPDRAGLCPPSAFHRTPQVSPHSLLPPQQLFQQLAQFTPYVEQQPWPPFMVAVHPALSPMHLMESTLPSAAPVLRNFTPEWGMRSYPTQTIWRPLVSSGPSVPVVTHVSNTRPPPGFMFTPHLRAHGQQQLLHFPNFIPALQTPQVRPRRSSPTHFSPRVMKGECESSVDRTASCVSENLIATLIRPQEKVEQPSDEPLQQPQQITTFSAEDSEDVSTPYTLPQQTPGTRGSVPTHTVHPRDLSSPQFSTSEPPLLLATSPALHSSPDLPSCTPQPQTTKFTIVISDGAPVTLPARVIGPEELSQAHDVELTPSGWDASPLLPEDSTIQPPASLVMPAVQESQFAEVFHLLSKPLHLPESTLITSPNVSAADVEESGEAPQQALEATDVDLTHSLLDPRLFLSEDSILLPSESLAMPSEQEPKLPKFLNLSSEPMPQLDSTLVTTVDDRSVNVQETNIMWQHLSQAPYAVPAYFWDSRQPPHLSLPPLPSMPSAKAPADDSLEETFASLQHPTSQCSPSRPVSEAQAWNLYSLFPESPVPWRQSLYCSRVSSTSEATEPGAVSESRGERVSGHSQDILRRCLDHCSEADQLQEVQQTAIKSNRKISSKRRSNNQ